MQRNCSLPDGGGRCSVQYSTIAPDGADEEEDGRVLVVMASCLQYPPVVVGTRMARFASNSNGLYSTHAPMPCAAMLRPALLCSALACHAMRTHAPAQRVESAVEQRLNGR